MKPASTEGIVAAVCITLLAVLALAGCTARAVSDYSSRKTIRDPDTGAIVYQRDVGASARQELPRDAAGPSTQSVGETGTAQGTAGTHEKPLAAYGIEQRQLIFYGGGAAAIFAAAVCVWFQQRFLAGCLVAAAIALILAPTFIEHVAPYVAAAAGVLVAIGLAWFGASVWRGHLQNLSGVASALKLAREGKADQAGAALREAPIARTAKAST